MKQSQPQRIAVKHNASKTCQKQLVLVHRRDRQNNARPHVTRQTKRFVLQAPSTLTLFVRIISNRFLYGQEDGYCP